MIPGISNRDTKDPGPSYPKPSETLTIQPHASTVFPGIEGRDAPKRDAWSPCVMVQSFDQIYRVVVACVTCHLLPVLNVKLNLQVTGDAGDNNSVDLVKTLDHHARGPSFHSG